MDFWELCNVANEFKIILLFYKRNEKNIQKYPELNVCGTGVFKNEFCHCIYIYLLWIVKEIDIC